MSGCLKMLSHEDSNLDKQNQNLLCYHYTIGQSLVLSVKKRCKDIAFKLKFQIFAVRFLLCRKKVVPCCRVGVTLWLCFFRRFNTAC